MIDSQASSSSGSAAADAMPRLLRLLRLPAVKQATGLGRPTIYRMVAERTFPAPVKVSKRAVAWRDNDIRQWNVQRPSTQR
jgi:prophage regulatory protein